MPSYTLQKRLGLEQGDRLLLDFGDRENEYEVAGFFNSLMWNGSYALVGERFLKLDSGLLYYSDLYVKTSGSADEVAEAIKEKLARRRPWVTTMDEMEGRDRQSNKDMFLVLQGFSLMTMFIGIIGVLNNYLLSFIERKRSLALLRSVGMSKKQGVFMLFLEALSGGLVDEFVAIMGPSGSGKSTLLYLMGGLDKPTSGSIRIDGRDLSLMNDLATSIFRRRDVGFVFQFYNLIPNLTVEENVLLPLLLDGKKQCAYGTARFGTIVRRGARHELRQKSIRIGAGLPSISNAIPGVRQEHKRR